MVAVGLGVIWAAYYAGLWGYCLIRGYDVPFTALIHSSWAAGSVQAQSPSAHAAAPAAA